MATGMEWLGSIPLGNSRYPQLTRGKYRLRLVDIRIAGDEGSVKTGVAEFQIVIAEGSVQHPDFGHGPFVTGDKITYVETLNLKEGGMSRFGRMIAALAQRSPEHFEKDSKQLTADQRSGFGTWITSKDADGKSNAAKFGMEILANVLVTPAVDRATKAAIMNEGTGKQKQWHNPTFSPIGPPLELNAQGRPTGSGIPATNTAQDSSTPDLPNDLELPGDLELPNMAPETIPVVWKANGTFQNPVRKDNYFQKGGAILFYSTKELPAQADWVKYQAGVHPAPENP